MKKIISLLVIVYALSSQAQDINLLNPAQSLIRTNPSFAGSNGAIRNQFSYLNSSPSMGNLVALYNSVDAYIKPLHGGLALSGMVVDEGHGTLKSKQLNLVYAPIFECKQSGIKIIPSVQISYLQRTLDLDRLTYSNFQSAAGFVWNLNQPSPSANTKNNFDATAGLLINYRNFYAGASAFHINQPDMGILGIEKLPVRYNFNLSYNMMINERTLLNFSAIYGHQQKSNMYQLAVNAILFKHLFANIGYVVNDAVCLNLGYRNNRFSLSAGYGYNTSVLVTDPNIFQLNFGLRLRKRVVTRQPESFEKW